MVRVVELDSSCQPVDDLLLAERFYREVLGQIFGDAVSVEHWSTSASTEEILDLGRSGSPIARLAAQGVFGEDDPAFHVTGVPYATARIGRAVVPLLLHLRHVQEPPPEQLRGTPRLAFPVTPAQLQEAMEILRRSGVPFEGPVEHPTPCPAGRSIYFKDPSSNFLELCCPRQGD